MAFKNRKAYGQVQQLLEAHFNLTGEITRLPGENDNYLVSTPEGPRFILKIVGPEMSSAILDLEHQILQHLHACELDLDFPTTILTNQGDPYLELEQWDGAEAQARLQTQITGTPLGHAGLTDPAELRSLGAMLARLDLALAAFSAPAARRTHRWDLTAASQHRHKAELIEGTGRRGIVEWMFHLYAASVLPRLANLPTSLIHGDANDENLLLQDGELVGLIDFGDSLLNPTICELAIALAYVMLGQGTPLVAGASVVGGYHTVRPLTRTELEVLYPLICVRLCTTVAVAAERRGLDPGHPTWFVTEERAWGLLEEFSRIDPIEAAHQLAAQTGITPFKGNGSQPSDILEKRKTYLGTSLSLAYQTPLTILRGSGQYLFDDRGHPFLDLVNNVCHVGHCHPRVVEAGQRQLALLNTNTRYLYDGLTDYAERLCATLPAPLQVCYFVNSGSEANELALRLAETHTGGKDWLVIDGAYHGNTSRLIDLSPYKFMGKGGKGEAEPWVHVVPTPDPYRGLHQMQGVEGGAAYAEELARVMEHIRAPIAGFIAEPLMGCAGQVMPPEGYFENAFRHVRDAGGICVIDEVQVGFGRVGTHFWAFERQGVVPDIVVMGKPIGNGHPMAAVVTTREIADSFANGMEFFSTFGGNPVSCAIGMAVLDVIEDEELQAHAHDLGAHFLAGLRELMNEYDLIGDVRGAGLFIGVELVRDRDTLEPAAKEADRLIERMKARGILLSTDGPFHNVIKIKPPMVLNRDDVDMVLRVMWDAFSGLQRA